MKRVGEILRARRIQQQRTLDEVAEEIKVRTDFLRAIEEGDYTKLPNPIYTRGFIRNYAIALGLDAEREIMPFYRREIKNDRSKSIGNPPQPIDKPRFSITPGVILSSIATIAILIFLATLFWQYRSFAGTPVLLIQQPPTNLVTTKTSIEVRGRTDPSAKVTINGQETPVDQDGRFRLHLSLKPGLNRVEIRAINQLGKEAHAKRLVTVKSED